MIINPDLAQRAISEMYLVVSGTKDAIMMVEADANEISEEVMLKAILFAHEQIKKIVEFVESIVKSVGKEKDEYAVFKAPEEIEAEVTAYAKDKMKAATLQRISLKEWKTWTRLRWRLWSILRRYIRIT